MNNLLELYVRCGKSLKCIGINSAVLPLENVSEALTYFIEIKKIILGGDLYIKNSIDQFENFYADWSYNGSDYIESIENAKLYLDQFTDEKIYVAFVLKS